MSISLNGVICAWKKKGKGGGY